jgi:hypothetical protein
MYYESTRTLLEKEFDKNNFNKNQKSRAMEILTKLFDNIEKLTITNPIYLVAAIAFFVLLESGKTRNFKQLGEDFGVEAKTIALKVKELTQILDINHPEEIIKKGLFVIADAINQVEPLEKKLSVDNIRKNIPEDILRTRRNINSKIELKDQELIDLFKQFRQFASLIFKDKDYIEIKQFLKLLELNLYMSGYDIKNLEIEKKFGDLFIYLGFEPKKGREAEKFVRLKDRFGQAEPYTLIKLGE